LLDLNPASEMVGANQQRASGDSPQLDDHANEVWSDGTLRHVFENSPDAILIIQDGKFIDCNRAAVEMFRSDSKQELLSQSHSQLSPWLQPDGEASATKLRQMIDQAVAQGSHRFEWVAKRRDSTEFPAEVLLTNIPLPRRQLLHVVWRDISRRKEAERALLQAREKEDAFRAGQGRVLEMIARGAKLPDVLARLVYLIEAQSEGMYCSVLQLSEDGKHIRSGAAPNLPEFYVKAVDGAPIGPKNGSCGTAMYLGKPVVVTDILDNPLWEDYYELARLSGLRACWSTPIFSGAGKVLGSFAMYYREPQSPTGSEARLTEVATRIAGVAIEHERSEAQLLDTRAELAHVARVTMMGELAASIAHEVNQPLGAIVGNADICLDWIKEENPNVDQLREALEDIASDGQRASEVISRIRSLVKKHVPAKSLVDLNGIAFEVMALVNHEAQKKQVAVSAELGDSMPGVLGDRVQLQQVLLNLVMNGIEAMNEVAGKRELTLRTEVLAGAVVTTVSDSGVGFDEAQAPQIFKPFHTTKPGGMGMGLAISRSIIESHGGKLWAEANPDGGAIFRFTLPTT